MAGNLEELAKIVGHDNALKLARSCRGKRRLLYVPIHAGPADRIVRLIGRENFQRLHSEFAGCQLTLADPDRFDRLEQARRRLKEERLPIAQLAAQAGVSRHFLYNQLARR